MNGWVLIHKKIWESDNFRPFKNRGNMILVWIWLLCHCDENGVVTCGRNQIADDTSIHPSSVKRCLKNIKKRPEVTYKATKTHTTISFLKWEEYQRKRPSIRTISEPQATTNKEERIKKELQRRVYKKTIEEVTDEDKIKLVKKFSIPLAEVELKIMELANWRGYPEKVKDVIATLRVWIARAIKEGKIIPQFKRTFTQDDKGFIITDDEGPTYVSKEEWEKTKKEEESGEVR